MTKESDEIRTHFLNLARSDMINSFRVNDVIKEKLTTALLAKVDEMKAEDILACIEKLDNSKLLVSYQSLCKVFSDC